VAVEQVIVFLCVGGCKNAYDGKAGVGAGITVDQIGEGKRHIMLF
jgi:hypothetical protein